MLLASIIFAISANIDTLILFIPYGLNNTKIPLLNKLLIAIISSIGTYISINFGQTLGKFLPKTYSNFIGGFILILLGISIIYQAIIKKETPVEKLSNLSLAKTMFLAITLSIHDISVGIAAGICEINALLTTIFHFISLIIIIYLGLFIGKNIKLKTPSKYFEILSGVLVILIGVLGIVG
ncbi:MAG: manganese efflux pump [Clostridia bacterium]|nr:manganese efflux pump [Clostridia bacterium]